MGKDSETKREELSAKGLKTLRGELWVILPFFAFSLFIFLGSFQYKPEAKVLPMLVGLFALVLTGMRLFHIIFPRSKIGEFREVSLAGKFDDRQEEIKKEVLKSHDEEEAVKEITSRDELKALISLMFCGASFILFGYLVGTFFVVVGTSYYYGYKKKGPLLITLASLYFLVYGILYKLMGASADFGLILGPILKSLSLI